MAMAGGFRPIGGTDVSAGFLAAVVLGEIDPDSALRGLIRVLPPEFRRDGRFNLREGWSDRAVVEFACVALLSDEQRDVGQRAIDLALTSSPIVADFGRMQQLIGLSRQLFEGIPTVVAEGEIDGEAEATLFDFAAPANFPQLRDELPGDLILQPTDSGYWTRIKELTLGYIRSGHVEFRAEPPSVARQVFRAFSISLRRILRGTASSGRTSNLFTLQTNTTGLVVEYYPQYNKNPLVMGRTDAACIVSKMLTYGYYRFRTLKIPPVVPPAVDLVDRGLHPVSPTSTSSATVDF